MWFERLKLILPGAVLILLVACRPAPANNATLISDETPAAIETPTLPAVQSPTAVPATATATSLPATPTTKPAATETAVPVDLSISAENVRLYPVPFIISGDLVTFQVLPHVPDEVTVSNVGVEIFVDDQAISAGMLSSRNWAGQGEGIFKWVWDTNNSFGDHTVRVVLDREDLIQDGDENQENNETTFTVNVRPVGERPLEERDATWVTAETDCCTVNILTRTAAYRDLPQLLEAVEFAVSQAAIRIQEEPDHKINVFFIDKTFGQGGFAGSEMTLTYVDRPYFGGNLHELLVHEAVHVIDRQFAPQRIKFLAEGVAVWTSGGHYKPENLNQRSAALLETGQYIPLSDLVADFYPAQHEIGYLQAGAFVTYLVDQFGWSTFREFYSDTSADDASTEAESLDLNLQTYYGLSLAEMEAEWLDFVRTLSPDETEIADLETSIRYYEIMRRYQEIYDPTAHFLGAWLPNPVEVQEDGNPADLTRHPQAEINVTLEVMLQNAEDALMERDFIRANVLLNSIERILDEDGAFADPVSSSYLAIVQITTAFGYEVQDVDLRGDAATVLATTASGIRLTDLKLERKRGDWVLLTN
jgi:hypothetical protein